MTPTIREVTASQDRPVHALLQSVISLPVSPRSLTVASTVLDAWDPEVVLDSMGSGSHGEAQVESGCLDLNLKSQFLTMCVALSTFLNLCNLPSPHLQDEKANGSDLELWMSYYV